MIFLEKKATYICISGVHIMIFNDNRNTSDMGIQKHRQVVSRTSILEGGGTMNNKTSSKEEQLLLDNKC